MKIIKLSDRATIPTYATDGSACFDLYAAGDTVGEHKFGEWSAFPGDPREIGTGLAFEVPEGFVMLVFSRSGHGFNNDVRLANCVGVIDSDYRGEVRVKLTADTGGGMTVGPGDRIAQAMVLPVQQQTFEVVGDLSKTRRGTGGFGSTGAA